MTTSASQAIHAAQHKKAWGRAMALRYAQNRNIVALYRLACQLEAAT